MNIADTTELLIEIQGRTQRTFGEVDIAAWAHDLADVAPMEASAAATAFFATEIATRRPIMPTDIVLWVQAERRRSRERQHTDQLVGEARAAYAEITAGGVDPYDGARNSPGLEALHVEAMRVPCPTGPRGCGQPVGARCQRRMANGDLVSTKIPHTARSVAGQRLVEAEGGVSALGARLPEVAQRRDASQS